MKKCAFSFFLLLLVSFLCPHLLLGQVIEEKPNYDKTYLPEGRDPHDTVFVFIEEMPTMAGGKPALLKFLQNVPTPNCVRTDSIADVVVVKFIVEADGTISDLRVVRSPDDCFTNAATSYMKQMPKWIPGKRNGREVACLYTLPVMFRKK